jgi:inosine/xanthosine triphosphatase
MKKVVVGSENPTKIAAAKIAFESAFSDEQFSFQGVKAVSGVSDQPLSEEETVLGASNRIASAKSLAPGADFYIAMEGGVEDRNGELDEFAWIIVESSAGKRGKGRTGTFIAPDAIRRLIVEEGKELGHATDIVFGDTNSKHKGGAVGHLTRGAIDRTELYRHAAIFALIPFIREDLY